MPGEGVLQFQRLGIPQPHRLVRTSTGKGRTIGAEHYTPVPLRILGECCLVFTGLDIPQPYYRVPNLLGMRVLVRTPTDKASHHRG